MDQCSALCVWIFQFERSRNVTSQVLSSFLNRYSWNDFLHDAKKKIWLRFIFKLESCLIFILTLNILIDFVNIIILKKVVTKLRNFHCEIVLISPKRWLFHSESYFLSISILTFKRFCTMKFFSFTRFEVSRINEIKPDGKP
jgi:hypothetical protein